MSRAASPLREKALKIWLKSGKTKRLIDIASELGISPGIIRKWKHEFNWDSIPLKQPRGAPIGNRNAAGNAGGAPPGNQNAMTHGLLSKHIPAEIAELMEELNDKDPVDMLWDMAMALYAKMIRSLGITFVKDKDDLTRVLKRIKKGNAGSEKEWDIQHAHDKVQSDLKSFSTASREFRGAVRQFLAAAPENDERRLKAELLQEQVQKTRAEVSSLKNPHSTKPIEVMFNIPRPPKENI